MSAKKPELGTCQVKHITYELNEPHEKMQKCVGWQALPPEGTPRQISGRRESAESEQNKRACDKTLVSPPSLSNERPDSTSGESGAGTLRERAEKFAEKHVIPSWRATVSCLLEQFARTERKAALREALKNVRSKWDEETWCDCGFATGHNRKMYATGTHALNCPCYAFDEAAAAIERME